MRLEDYDTGEKHTATVESVALLTPPEVEEVRELVLIVDHPDFEYEIGQSIGVIVPGPHPMGHGHHFRLYTVADTPGAAGPGHPRITICVKRCMYIDDYSGERYRGIASNYLNDRRPGDRIVINGPFGLPFEVPEDRDADLLMIGLGTGIAPFRAFVRHIYRDIGGWDGRVRLFHGARTGLELLYMNDYRNDFANYYDEDTFRAFEALSPRPHVDEPAALGQLLEAHQEEVWAMINSPRTHVYVAGLEAIAEMLDEAFARMAGSKEKWARRKAEMIAGRRWNELIYERETRPAPA